MKYRNLRVLILGGIVVAASAIVGCGGGGNETLTISPIGPTIVEKGTTLQFTSNRDDVTWSVAGGNANGTISASGLYTPPSTLPLDESDVSVLVEDSDGNSAEAFVSLRTGDTLTLSASSRPVGPNQIEIVDAFDFGLGFNSNRLAVGLGSIHELSIFSNGTGSISNVFLAQALDLGSFGEPLNITNQNTDPMGAGAIELDSELNPHVLVGRTIDGSRLFMLSSIDGGQTFGDLVELVPDPNADVDQIMTSMTIDDNDDLHVVFSSQNDTAETGAIIYTKSTDGGATWSDPVPVEEGHDEFIFPTIAVSPDGNTVYVSYYDAELDRALFEKSTDGGASFGGQLVLSGQPVSAAPFTKVALDPSGNIYYSLSDDLGADGSFEFVVRRSTDGGASFGAAVPVKSNPNPIIFGNMAVDNLGRVDAVFSFDSDNTGTDLDTLVYSRSNDGGQTFSEPVDVAVGTSPETFIITGLRHDDSGRLYIQFFETPGLSVLTGTLTVRTAE